MNRALAVSGSSVLPPATVVAGAGLTAPAVIAEAGEKAAWLLSSCTQPVDSLSFVVNELLTALNV